MSDVLASRVPDTLDDGGGMKQKVYHLKVTENMDRLWSCETARWKYPDQIGKKPNNAGKEIWGVEIQKPSLKIFCTSKRFFRPLDCTEDVWVCEHLVEIIE